jgi:hypothetical protein
MTAPIPSELSGIFTLTTRQQQVAHLYAHPYQRTR